MNEKKRLALVAGLSPRAASLYKRVCDGYWYKAHAENLPKAMDELVEAGLVVLGGRVEVMSSAYVPIGTKPFRVEQYPAHCNEKEPL